MNQGAVACSVYALQIYFGIVIINPSKAGVIYQSGSIPFIHFEHMPVVMVNVLMQIQTWVKWQWRFMKKCYVRIKVFVTTQSFVFQDNTLPC